MSMYKAESRIIITDRTSFVKENGSFIICNTFPEIIKLNLQQEMQKTNCSSEFLHLPSIPSFGLQPEIDISDQSAKKQVL